MAEYGPYTSKDIDYFGYREAAEKLASALNGKVLIPDADDHSPQTAIVMAVVEGQEIEIDFLWHVKGVEEESLKKQAVEIRMTVRMGERYGELIVPLMHPMHCLQSRLANVVELGRTQDLAKRQLEASPIVLREFLQEQLEKGKSKHVTGVLKALFDYLSSNMVGRKAHLVMKNDPAAILDVFQDDQRLDPRWREQSLASMRAKLAARRTAWGKMKAHIQSAPERWSRWLNVV